MAVTTTLIAVGEGTIYIGESTGDPVADDLTAADVGATQDGCSISWEPDMVDINVDQLGDAARVIQSRQKVMFKTTMAEGTLYNLAQAWGYSTGVGSNSPGLTSGYTSTSGTFNLGIHPVYPTEKHIRVTANAPGSTASVTKIRTYKCNRAISYDSVEYGHQREDNVKYQVSFRILPNTSQTGKEYGTIVDA